jgi:FkbM family methyltransferase
VQTVGINRVLDVGANAGQFGQTMRRSVGYTGQIDSFEPQSAVFEKLTAAADGDPLWHTHNLALGSERCRKPLLRLTGDDLSSFRQPKANAAEIWPAAWNIEGTEEVEIETLTHFLGKLSSDCKLLLKLDTQGYDLNVIDGASGIMENVMVLVVELPFQQLYENVPPVWQTCETLVSKYGLRLTGLYPVSRAQNHTIIEADGVFLRY